MVLYKMRDPAEWKAIQAEDRYMRLVDSPHASGTVTIVGLVPNDVLLR